VVEEEYLADTLTPRVAEPTLYPTPRLAPTLKPNVLECIAELLLVVPTLKLSF
jgi:hypothetical protein